MNGPDQQGLAQFVLRREILLVAGLSSIVIASWGYLAWMAGDAGPMGMHAGHSGASGAALHGAGIGWTLIMWIVMIGAMMMPTAAPMIVIHARFQRGRQPDRSPAAHTSLFAAGYLVAWSLYALLATVAQFGLERTALFHPLSMKLSSPPLAAAVLIAAGLFQFSSLKEACLTQCRTPVGFFMGAWREGRHGAFAMGLHHGIYCVGCCWALMALMFVVGTMNMLWIGLLTAFMLYEKIGPAGTTVARLAGAVLIASGCAVLVM